jgi:large subunit ribosomal protein L30
MEEKESKTEKENLIIVIRISGMVKVNADIQEALHRLRLRRKYSCVVLKPTKEILGVIEKVKFYVAYGEISKDVLVKLLEARGVKVGEGKLDASAVAEGLISGKSLKDLDVKPFFRLHPPRKGIKSKLQYPKGVLGNNKQDINKLIERML